MTGAPDPDVHVLSFGDGLVRIDLAEDLPVIHCGLEGGGELTVRLHPDHVELISLTFAPGTRAAGHPPLDVADMALAIDEEVSLLIARVSLLAKVRDVLGRELTEDQRRQVWESPRLRAEVTNGARQRGWVRHRLDPDFLAEVVKARAEPGMTLTKLADYYGSNIRTVSRWLARAKDLGIEPY